MEKSRGQVDLPVPQIKAIFRQQGDGAFGEKGISTVAWPAVNNAPQKQQVAKSVHQRARVGTKKTGTEVKSRICVQVKSRLRVRPNCGTDTDGVTMQNGRHVGQVSGEVWSCRDIFLMMPRIDVGLCPFCIFLNRSISQKQNLFPISNELFSPPWSRKKRV